jgi:cyanophycin synthetase
MAIPVTDHLRVNFEDGVLRFDAANAGVWSRSSFMMALAAFQRGLEVVFHRSAVGKTDRFRGGLANGLTGELFSISDGATIHFFNRTMGDQTSLDASMLAEDKSLTKQALARAGIRTPEGVVVKSGDVKRAADFMSASGSTRFVIKPVRGSLSKDTHIDIPAADVCQVIRDARSADWLIEEFIPGHEVRAYVVGEKCVGVTILFRPSITGNGVDTIATLVTRKNSAREHKIVGRKPFIFEAKALAFLQKQGLTPDSVPQKGAVITLSTSNSLLAGADSKNAYDIVNESFRDVAVASCRALRLPNAGLDIIISDDPARPGAFLLEANQRAHTAYQSFPTLGEAVGNDISEAILDLYFPESRSNRRFVSASFDFSQITKTLQSLQIDEVRLPVLKSDWQHCRINFPDAANGETIWNILISVGCYGRLLNLSNGNQVADVLLSPESQSALAPHRTQIAALSPEIEAVLYNLEVSFPLRNEEKH